LSSKSKIKGATWERDIAKFLSALYGGSFIRTPHSGAYIGGKNTTRKDELSDDQIKSFKGDIIGPDNWRKFNLEAKNYASFPFNRITTGNVPILEKWIGQMLEASDPGDISVLAIKITRAGKYMVFNKSDEFTATNFMQYNVSGTDWVITDFDDFFKQNAKAFESKCTLLT
jgi:hypothetical protein